MTPTDQTVIQSGLLELRYYLKSTKTHISPIWSITTQGEKLKKDWAGKEKGGWGKGGYSIGEKIICIVNGRIIK